VALGLNVRRRALLPAAGPAIVVANHNSHLDTLVLFALFPVRVWSRLRPVGAADYWLRNRWIAWFARRVLGIAAIQRGRPAPGADPLAECRTALDRGEILIIFPEGTRGEPEQRSPLKHGVTRLAAGRPECPLVPVYLHGLGKCLPRGSALLVPFFVDVFVGDALYDTGDRAALARRLDAAFATLEHERAAPAWN
jgi:1-acyl-sn-glycerol-3-phosphate acyltransferase